MKKQVLILTGRAAASAAKKAAESAASPVEVRVCDVDVAAFLSPESIEKELSSVDLSGVSLVLVSGAVKGSLSDVGRRLGVPCLKGPSSVSDLPLVLKKLAKSEINLSPDASADRFIVDEMRKRDDKLLAAIRKEKVGFGIGRRPIYLRTGLMRVLAEIPDAPRLSSGEVGKMASYFVESGASIIDLGMVYGGGNQKEIPRLVDAVRSAVDVPVSIDSLDRKEILAAVDCGVDLVLSLDAENLDIASSIDVPAVVIPRDGSGVPKAPEGRVRMLEKLIKQLDSLGFRKYIADLVVDPPMVGLMDSFSAYAEFRRRHPTTPMLAGVGNVTEMIDADSVGVNAILAAECAELGVDIMFTTEASAKTRGCVRELASAAELMYLAKERNQPPKDLSRSLLVLKEKRQPEKMRREEVAEVEASAAVEDALESAFFRINVSDRIEAVYYLKEKPKLRFVGSSAEAVYKEIFSRKLVGSLSHAAYLGRELAKAEIALKLHKNYIQDEEMF